MFRFVLIFLTVFVLHEPAFAAADFSIEMDSNNGSSGFIFRDSALLDVAEIDSDGNFVITGGMRIDSGGVENSASETAVIDVSVSSPLFQGFGAAVTFGNVGSGTTVTGSSLTVVPTAWTATPTISGPITATSGLTANGTLTANAAFTLGDGGDLGSINTSDWDISTTGAMTGIGNIANNGVYTQTGADANTLSANTTANGTLDANGLFTLGDNGETGAIDTSDWDISTTGVLTGISGITTNGAYTQSGASANTFSGAITANAAFTLGDNGDLGSINTSDWDISTTGVLSGISGIANNGVYTQSGATANTFSGTVTCNGQLDANNTFTLGDGGDTGTIDTNDWDVSTTGVMTGVSGITNDGAYTQSGASNNTFTGDTGIGAAPVDKLSVEGVLALREQAAAPGATANYGKVFTRTSDSMPYYQDDAGAVHLLMPEYVKITHQTGSGVGGGNAGTNTWNVRPLTNEEFDAGNNASIAANIITLQPGTYRFMIQSQARYVDRHKVRLYNVTGGSTVGNGTSEFSQNANGDNPDYSFTSGEFTIGAATQFRIDHWTNVARATYGLGLYATPGVNEVYCIAEFWKIKE